MADQEKRGCFKTGALGCLGVVGVALLLSLLFGSLALFSVTLEADVVEETKTRALPGSVASPASLESLRDAGAPQQLPLASLPLKEWSGGVGTIRLDLAMGVFIVGPGDGPDVEIEAEYDRRRFRLVEKVTEGRDGDFTYDIQLKTRLGILPMGNIRNHVEIRLPRNQPLRLVGKIAMGESEIEIGGLTLLEVDLDVRLGQHTVTVSEPTTVPLELFALRGQMGEVRVRHLGNASPQIVQTSHRMGELRLGLEGEWRVSSDIEMRCSMGQCTVKVPDDVLLDTRARAFMGGKSVRLPDPDGVPLGAPTLRLDLGATMGELVVR